MSYKQQSPLPIIEGGTGTQLFQGGIGTNGYGVILSGLFSTDPLEVIQNTGTVGQVLTSNGVGARPTFENAAGGGVETLTGDTGGAISPSSGNINIIAGVSSQHSGSSVSFSGSGSTLELNVTDANFNVIMGSGAGNGTIAGSFNTVLGTNSGSLLTGGGDNVMIGGASGHNLTTGQRNVLIGIGTGNSYTSSEDSNILIGANVAGTIADSNTLRIGFNTGSMASELNRAFIQGIRGITPDVNDGLAVFISSTGQLTTTSPGGAGLASIAGDTGGAQTGPAIALDANATAGASVSFSGSANTISLNVTNSSNNTYIGLNAGNAGTSGTNNISLGQSSAVAAGTGNQNIMIGNGTGGSLTSGGSNIMIGTNAGNGLTSGANNIILGINAGTSGINANQNIIIGGSAGASLAGGASNIYIGQNAGSSSANDSNNLAIGINAGASIAGGVSNVLIGNGAGVSLGNASRNTQIGLNAGNSIATGIDNVIIGANAGTGYGSNESSNIVINDNGTAPAGQSNVLTIGAGTGTGAFQLNQSFIHGIRGITTVNADAVPVLVDSAGQLGTTSSSRRLKHDIQDMYDTSSPIYDLRPVTFIYNSDNSGKTQYGLIAEEVEAVFPDIVVRNQFGEIETVQYHILPVLLLNEIKKLNARIASLEARS